MLGSFLIIVTSSKHNLYSLKRFYDFYPTSMGTDVDLWGSQTSIYILRSEGGPNRRKIFPSHEIGCPDSMITELLQLRGPVRIVLLYF